MKSPLTRTERRGTTVVETALVLPVFLMFVLVLIEISHAHMIKNMLRGACREAARLGCTEGSTTSDVQALVLQILGGAVSPEVVQVMVKDGSSFDNGSSPPETSSAIAALPDMEVSEAEEGQLFIVHAQVSYNDVAVVPLSTPYLGQFMDNIVIEGRAFIRHE
jgi:Flp pilus assembly protein TadG